MRCLLLKEIDEHVHQPGIILGHDIRFKVSLQPEKDKISISHHFEMKSKILLLITYFNSMHVFIWPLMKKIKNFVTSF